MAQTVMLYFRRLAGREEEARSSQGSALAEKALARG